MEIAIGLTGLGLTVLGIVFAYIWKSNGKLQEKMMTALERIEQGQKDIAQGQKNIAQILENITQMLLNQTKILERIEGKIK